MAPERIGDAALYRLLNWLSPAFPVGGYSYSHGIEYAVEIGGVRDVETLTEWIAGILRFGMGRLESDLFRAAWHAAGEGDMEKLREVATLGDAYRATREFGLEAEAQGGAFLATLRAAWPLALPEGPTRAVYPVAVAAAAAGAGVPLRPSLIAYLHAVAANLVSAGVRLIPLGQTDGQRAVAALESVIGDVVDACLIRPRGDMGSCAAVVDWTSMRHETQYTRLFRS